MKQSAKSDSNKQEDGKARRKEIVNEQNPSHPSQLMETAQDPGQASPEAIKDLQRSHGNRFVQRVIEGNSIQRETIDGDLTVGGNLRVGGSVGAGGSVDAGGTVNAGDSMQTSGSFAAGSSISGAADISAGSSLGAGTNVEVGGNVSSGGSMSAGGSGDIGGDLSVGGTVRSAEPGPEEGPA